MGKVVFDISMSLDGFITAANVRPDEPLGDGGERLHEWAFGGDERSSELLAEAGGETGAVICGRNTYDASVPWWGADGPTGPARLPVFVVTHSEPEEQPEDGVYTFVTGGTEAALEQARETAGEKTVAVMGGADLGRQCIRAGLVDEISIHLVPVLFGSGTRMFEDLGDETSIDCVTLASMRVWLVGFGMVGRWLAAALDSHAERLVARYGVEVTLVGVANARDGFVHAADGIDLRSALALAGEGGSLADLSGVRRWPSALEGLRATDADLLVEVTASPATGGEPGLSHMREALARGVPVVTSNKWPVALHGLELAELARARGVAFRAESSVMSGTPLLSSLTDGLAGAIPVGLRGLLNATANFILTRMAEGMSYEDALAEAQAAGLAEPDPAADVEGHDSVAKVMILSALVFRRQLRLDQVARRGIDAITQEELDEAAATGKRLKHLATLEFSEPDGTGDVTARVEPALLRPEDPLARIEGTTNAVVCRAIPVREVAVAGPGAGPELAGQGVLSDLIAVARR